MRRGFWHSVQTQESLENAGFFDFFLENVLYFRYNVSVFHDMEGDHSMTNFAEQLTAARKAAGMTQEELSEAVHVARNTISNWERGQRQPDLDTLRLLGQVLHTDF